ncbi:hypothetical protein [Stenotrophomonas chelatiphaga]|uniref:hypothetical protein n=1 Tax=Stenotrophomonas chelatiphaga TaxID=517011 RepID=UPI0028A07EEB|nr:hypothetical protein [Stenotrophomonas chelatiphaga]
METNYPLSAKRLYALIGDRISEFPPYFIERLEHRLEETEQLRARSEHTVNLRLVPDVGSDAPLLGPDSHAEVKRHGKVGVPIRTLQALGSVLEILHAVHVAKPQVHPEAQITGRMVEGLIVCGREMVKSSMAEMWGEP